MPTLDDWFAAGTMIDRLYREELLRPNGVLGEFGGAVNWLYHWREGSHDEAWIRDRIRESEEWQLRHPETVDVGGSPTLAQPSPPVVDPPPGGGGFLESITSRAVRPRLSRSQIAAVVPDRGPGRFPSPYGTRFARVTNASDGMVRPVGMSYWPILNNATGRASLTALVSLDDTLTLFSIDKATLSVQRGASLPFHSTGEFCYWSFSDPDLLYVPDGSRLIRYNVASHQVEVAVEAPGPITQCHSSYDGQTHSMTLDGGPAVWRNGRLQRVPVSGSYDECQIDKSGRWLLVKVNNDNLILDLDTQRTSVITNSGGAVGHSDMGWGYMVGEDDQTDPGGVFRLWVFGENGPIDRGPVYATTWAGMTRYVSHCNVIRSGPEHHDVLFSSSHDGEEPRANELVLCRLDGGGLCTVVCPNLTDLSVGQQDDDARYWKKTRACLDPTGRYAAWSANCGTDRLDVFVVELP